MKRGIILAIIVVALPLAALGGGPAFCAGGQPFDGLQFEMEARPLISRHTVEVQDRITLNASKTQAELSATAVWRKWLAAKYSVTTGFTADGSATVFGPITIGDTEFTSPRTRSGGRDASPPASGSGTAPTATLGILGVPMPTVAPAAAPTGDDKPLALNLDWTTRPTHRLECSVLFDFPIRPVILAEWASHTLRVMDADGKTAEQDFRRCFIGYGGAIGFTSKWADTELLIAGSSNLLRIEACASTQLWRNTALTAGCIWETQRHDETRIRTISPFVGLAASLPWQW